MITNSALSPCLHIIGSGAIGSLLAAAAARHNVDYAMYPRHLPAFKQYVSWSDNERIHLHSIRDTKPQLSENDVLIVPLKVYQIREALLPWAPLLDKKTPVVLMHNGMGGEEIARQLLPSHQPIWLATTSHGAMRQDSHTVIYTGKGGMQIGVAGEPFAPSGPINSDAAPLPVQLLDQVLPPVTWERNIELALWRKLAVNMVINPLTAIHNVPNRAIAMDEFATLRHTLCREFVTVAKTCGHHFDPVELEELIVSVALKTGANYSSMHQDVHYNRPTEIDAINGYIVNMANKKGINVAVNALLVEQVKTLSQIIG